MVQFAALEIEGSGLARLDSRGRLSQHEHWDKLRYTKIAMDNVPKYVVGRLQSQELGSESHPDADLLTAFAERSLDERERGGVMKHLALCGDCREVVALAMPEADLQQVLTLPRQNPAGWFGWPALLRWGVLAAGMVGIAAVGFQYSHFRAHQNIAASVRSTVPAVSTTTSGTRQPLSDRVANSPDEASRNAGVLAHRVVQEGPEEHSRDRAGDSSSGNSAADNSSAMVAMNRAPVIGNNSAGTEIVKAKAPVPMQAASGGQIPTAPNLPLQTSPSMMMRASPQWAITTTGILRRSFDGGKSWETISPSGESTASEGSMFRAVAGTGSEVWVGGAAGMLYHSADSGNHWNRVTPSDGSVGLTGEIVSIEFSDPQHGRISTSNSELWVTSDSAQSWQKQQ